MAAAGGVPPTAGIVDLHRDDGRGNEDLPRGRDQQGLRPDHVSRSITSYALIFCMCFVHCHY